MTRITQYERSMLSRHVSENPREGVVLTSHLRDQGEVQVLRQRPDNNYLWFRSAHGFWVTKPEFGWYNWLLTRRSRRRLKKVVADYIRRHGEAIFLTA